MTRISTMAIAQHQQQRAEKPVDLAVAHRAAPEPPAAE